MNMMKKWFLPLLFAAAALLPVRVWAVVDGLREKIEALGDVTAVTPLPAGEYADKYEVMLRTPLDWSDPSKGEFVQRAILMHVGYDRPTMVITNGYDGGFALNERYREELSRLFDLNVLFVEHRYFAKSMPEPCDWRYLTAENSAHDLHHIVTAFKQLYPSKWISSGISKGGTTTMLYCAYYPDDADIWVPYVGPLCNAREDKRFKPFFASVGTPEVRKRVEEFQLEALRRRDALLPEFQKRCEADNLRFRIPVEEVYDYCVLEYAFSFWQWGMPADKIPAPTASDREILDYLYESAGPDYFSVDNPTSSFFVQAARELGYYPYDRKPFRKLLAVGTTRDYLRRLMLPEELRREKFDKSLYNKVRRYLERNDPRMICIYGGSDPWTAPGVTWLSTRGKKNVKVYVQPGGSHRTRILTLPEQMKREALEQIETWLEE